MNNIITNFLAFARPSPSGATPCKSVIDVGEAINDCMSLIKHSPEASEDHKFEIDATDNLLIAGDETQLKQVCWNLARNAIQSMPDGGTLNVTATADDESVRVEFTDTGVGMDREIRDHVFEPFISGSGGTGLGLSIVYKIVQDHGGHIGVDSEPGKGTRITVEFPKAANRN